MSSPRPVPAPADLAAVAAAMLRLNETIRLKGQRFEDEKPTAVPLEEFPEGIVERSRRVAREHDDAQRVARSWDDRLAAVESLRAALADRLRGSDFLAPHGWSGEVDDALEAERVALGDRKAFDLRACLILEDADPALFEGGLRQVFRPSEAVAEAMAEREKRALLLKAAAEAAMKAGEGEALVAPKPTEAPAAPSIDFAAIASKLRGARRPKVRQAMILELAIGKTELEAEDVAFHVHGLKGKPKPTKDERKSRDNTIRGQSQLPQRLT